MSVNINIEGLIDKAKSFLSNSYAPYSNIHVAAAVLTDKGNIYTGVNVENASYGLTICAERSAISAMVAAGERRPVAVAVVTDMDNPIPPCGACRQVIAEFNPKALIIMHSVKSGKTIVKNLEELFPQPFILEK
ncbi:cytidine deaminase [Desulfurococcus amylolyticus]|uniref:cytidine deaminase n=1 Tax=Desulfurococcus amylolyticus TaxID=94694 RepID=UPI0005B231CA|nr:cytidine deaminase [Desulfurococcus amylolyticus]